MKTPILPVEEDAYTVIQVLAVERETQIAQRVWGRQRHRNVAQPEFPRNARQ
jgi:hypothetical protein